jgi:hypothetical protein
LAKGVGDFSAGSAARKIGLATVALGLSGEEDE